MKDNSIQGTLSISYSWSREDGKRIKQEHVEDLEERNIKDIFKMLANGHTSGELQDILYTNWFKYTGGVHYSGHWTLGKTTRMQRKTKMDKKSQKLADKIQKYLEEHNDDEDHIRYLGSEKFTITAAVGILLDGTKCGWFLDVIYGIHSIKKFKKFKGPETWTFTKDGRGGIITGIDSRNKVICEQRVVGVDFPFDSTKLLVDYMDFDETYVLFEEEYRG